ncbi:MAG: hypothetical protein AAGA03_07330 [Planctomycetota bacterium]
MFDPLHKWLGIPPREQPPDHYRLLGVARFESDEQVIDAAADRQLTFLHDLSNGPHAETAEEIANQVSSARLTLVNPKRRAAYDAKLMSEAIPKKTANSVKEVVATPVVQAEVVKAEPANNGWYVRHQDHVVHGPYTMQSLVTATKQGTIVATTELKHASETANLWVASPQVLDQIPQASPQQPSPSSSQTESSPSQRATAASGMRVRAKKKQRPHWISSVLYFLPMLITVLPLIAIYRKPEILDGIRRLVFPAMTQQAVQQDDSKLVVPDPAPERELDQATSTVRPPMNATLPPRPSRQQETRTSGPVRIATNSTTLGEPRLPQRTPPSVIVDRGKDSDPMGRPIRANGAKPVPDDAGDVTKSEPLLLGQEILHKLSFESSRWTFRVKDVAKTERLIVSRVKPCPVSYQVAGQALLTDKSPVQIEFDQMGKLTLSLIAVRSGTDITISAAWTCHLVRAANDPFDLKRLERKRRVEEKRLRPGIIKCAAIENQIGIQQKLMGRLSSASSQFRSQSIELDNLRKQYANAKIAADAERAQITAFETFAKNVTEMGNQSFLSIRKINETIDVPANEEPTLQTPESVQLH